MVKGNIVKGGMIRDADDPGISAAVYAGGDWAAGTHIGVNF